MKKLFSPKILALCLLAGIVLPPNDSYAQFTSTPRYAPPTPKIPYCVPVSPGASTLINQITYPVGYNTGSVDITIPLYEISIGSLKIPITLSYNTKGLRSSDLNSYLGLGWTLNAEPVILRKVNGIPDDSGYMTMLGNTYNANYASGSLLYDLLSPCTRPDICPDEYFYRLPNNSGSFLRIDDLEFNAETVPYDPVQVNTSNWKSFRMIDDNGFEYTFPGVDYCDRSGTSITAWRASKISSPFANQSINFSYKPITELSVKYSQIVIIEDNSNRYDPRQYRECDPRGPSSSEFRDRLKLPQVTQWSYNNQGRIGYYRWAVHSYADNIETEFGGIQHTIVEHNDGQCNKVEVTNLGGKYTMPSETTLRLSTITHEKGSIEFQRTTENAGPLSLMIIKDRNGNIIKQITFTHSNAGGKFKLDKITISDRNGNIIDSYTFTYNNFTNYGSGLFGVNFWDYTIPNMNSACIPPFEIDMYQHGYNGFYCGSYKGSLGDGMQSSADDRNNGMLTSITNHLGGKTLFSYEADAFVDYKVFKYNGYNTAEPNGGRSGGATRIAKITEIDGNKEYIRTIKYGGKENGLGIMRIFPHFPHFLSTQTKTFTTNNNNEMNNASVRVRTIQSSIISNASYGGIPVVYDTVTEYKQTKINGTIVSMGKSVYTYNYDRNYGHGTSCSCLNYDNGALKHNINTDPNDEWKYGQLLSKTDYKKEGDSYKVLNETKTSYTIFNPKIITVGKPYQAEIPNAEYEQLISADNFIGDKNVSKDYFYGMKLITYGMYYGGGVKKSEEITRTYAENSDQYVEVKKKYIYDAVNSNKVSRFYPRTIETHTGGEVMVEKIKYPEDVLNVNSFIIRNMHNNIMETQTTYPNGNIVVVNNDYSKFTITPSYIILRNNGIKFDTLVNYYMYDDFGNPTSFSENGLETVYIWGYDGQYLLAEIKNAGYSTVNNFLKAQTGKSIEQFSMGYTPNYNVLSQLRAFPSLAPAQITTYEYIPCVGMTRKTDPSGRSVYFTYDAAGRLTNVKDDSGRDVEGYKYNVKMN